MPGFYMRHSSDVVVVHDQNGCEDSLRIVCIVIFTIERGGNALCEQVTTNVIDGAL